MTDDDSSATRLALAEDLLDALNFDAPFEARHGTATGGDSAAARALREFQRRIVTAEMIRPHAAERYASQLTADDLRQLIAFFRRGSRTLPFVPASGRVFNTQQLQRLGLRHLTGRPLQRAGPGPHAYPLGVRPRPGGCLL